MAATRPSNTYLLDPKNDYVFKRLFTEHPNALIQLINDLRPDLTPVTEVEILNPTITPSEMQGKSIVLDILAQDIQGNRYNIEMQVRRYNEWGKRSAYYLAKMLTDQLSAGEDYSDLNAVIGIHLLDFDLYTANLQQTKQAIWRFEMRDGLQPDVSLGDTLQLNLIEMKKADRLGLGDQNLRDWITLFEHWHEETRMDTITNETVKEVRGHIKRLSADEEARRLAFVRERALRDEASQLRYAKQEGIKQGEVIGEAKLLQKMLNKRFGDLPEWATEKINSASSLQIEAWADQIFTVQRLEDLLK